MPEVTAEEVVADTLANARASGMDLTDCIKLLEHAHCLGCWNEAVNLYGVEGIKTDHFRYIIADRNFLARRT